MRFARKLALLAVAVVAALAVMAPAASATNNTVEIRKGAGGHCPASLVAGDVCKTHAEGEATLFGHVFGIESTEATCHVEFEGLLSETGAGRITSYTPTNGGHGETNCETVSPACSGSLPWTGDSERTSASVIEAHFDVCIDPSEIGTCTGEYVTQVTETGAGGADEVQTFSATDIRIGASSFCEITISAVTEDDATHLNAHAIP
jgi:hypothetical protein